MPEDDDKPKQKRAPTRPPGGVFDVRRPGRALASPTSRPVIMGHKPGAQAAQAAVSGIGEAAPAPARRKIEIAPSGDIQAVVVDPSTSVEGGLEPKQREVPEEDKEALAAAAIDGATGPPELPEQKAEPEPEQADKPSGESEDGPRVFTKPKLVIQPLSDDQKSGDKPAEATEGETKLPSEEKPGEPTAEGETKKTESTKSEDAAPAAEEPAAQPATEEIVPTTAAEGVEGTQEEEQKPEPHIDPLFDEHGVVVTHNKQVSQHSGGAKTFLYLFLILILAAIALDVLIDLEILYLPSVPHTDFL